MTSGRYKYAIKRGGKSYGISSIEQLKDMATRKKIEPQDHIYCYESEKWVRAGQINALSVIFAFSTDKNKINSKPSADDLSAPLLTVSQIDRHINPPTPEEQTIEPITKPARQNPIKRRRNTLDLNKLFEEFDLVTEPQIQSKPQRPSTTMTPAETESSINADEVIKSISSTTPAKTSYFSKKIIKTNKSRFEITTRTITLMAILLMIAVGALTFMAGSWLEKENSQITVTKLSGLETEPSLPIVDMDK